MSDSSIEKEQRLSRLFSDMGYRCADQYANWRPAVNFQVGGYGTLDKGSGEFVRKGNVLLGELAQRYRVQVYSQETEHRIKSGALKDAGLQGAISTDISELLAES